MHQFLGKFEQNNLGFRHFFFPRKKYDPVFREKKGIFLLIAKWSISQSWLNYYFCKLLFPDDAYLDPLFLYPIGAIRVKFDGQC